MGRILLGVCSRLAKAIGISEGIVRLVFITLLLLDPKFIVIYFILALLMLDGIEFKPDLRGMIAYSLLALGLLLIIRTLNPLVAGVVLILLALYMLRK